VGAAAHLQWPVTAASSFSSSSLFFKFVLSSLTRSCAAKFTQQIVVRGLGSNLVLQLLLRAQALQVFQFGRQLIDSDGEIR
jgi:hypothetical protein